jgi:hypothetical protein
MLRWDQGSVSLPSTPPAVSWPGASFPPRGPSGRFPRFHGTIRRSESPPPVPPHFVAFAWRYPGRIRVSLPRPPDAPAAGLESVTRYLPPGNCREGGGASQVPGEPRGERALFSDPGGIAGARPWRRRNSAFRFDDNVGSREFLHFGAQSHGPFTGCLRFAAPVARTPRKTRFRPLAELCRAGVETPQGSKERFPRYNRFLLSQAFLAHQAMKYSDYLQCLSGTVR